MLVKEGAICVGGMRMRCVCVCVCVCLSVCVCVCVCWESGWVIFQLALPKKVSITGDDKIENLFQLLSRRSLSSGCLLTAFKTPAEAACSQEITVNARKKKTSQKTKLPWQSSREIASKIR